MSERPSEYCCYCNEPTGKAGAGEDSIYWLDGNIGPLCETCSAALRQEILSDMGGLPLPPTVEAVIADCIPHTWLDPLLSGDARVVGDPPYTGQDIERLMAAVKDRLISALSRKEP